MTAGDGAYAPTRGIERQTDTERTVNELLTEILNFVKKKKKGKEKMMINVGTFRREPLSRSG